MYQWVTALKEPHLESINPYKFRSLNFRLRDFRRWNHFDLAEQETSFQWTTGNGLSQYMSPEIWVERRGSLPTANLLTRWTWHFLEYVDLGWYPFQCWWLLYIFITILQLVNTCNWCCNCPEEALDFLVFTAGGCDDHRSHRFRPSPEPWEVFWKWEWRKVFSLTKLLVAFLNRMFPKIGVPTKSSILRGLSIINHPFWGFPPICGNTQLYRCVLQNFNVLCFCPPPSPGLTFSFLLETYHFNSMSGETSIHISHQLKRL